MIESIRRARDLHLLAHSTKQRPVQLAVLGLLRLSVESRYYIGIVDVAE